METENYKPEVCWNAPMAQLAIQDVTDSFGYLMLAHRTDEHIELNPETAAEDPQLIDFLVDAVNTSREADIKAAYSFALTLHALGHTSVAGPRIADTGYLLAQKELAKAQQRFALGSYKSASDKGIWACTHFTDAIRFGNTAAIPRFYEAAEVTMQASAAYGGPVDRLDTHIFKDCAEVGIDPPSERFLEIRIKAYESALANVGNAHRARNMLEHAEALRECGFDDEGRILNAARTGINDTMLEVANDLFLREYLEIVMSSALSEKEKYAVMSEALLWRYAHYAEDKPVRYGRIYDAGTQERIAWDLTGIQHPDGQQLLLKSIQRQVTTVDSNYYIETENTIDPRRWQKYIATDALPVETYLQLCATLKDRLEAVQAEMQRGLASEEDSGWRYDCALCMIGHDLEALTAILHD